MIIPLLLFCFYTLLMSISQTRLQPTCLGPPETSATARQITCDAHKNGRRLKINTFSGETFEPDKEPAVRVCSDFGFFAVFISNFWNEALVMAQKTLRFENVILS